MSPLHVVTSIMMATKHSLRSSLYIKPSVVGDFLFVVCS